MTMTIDQFIQTYNGRAVDVDGAYGGQCWDLWSRYAQDVAGVPQSATNTVNGYAGSVYTSTWGQQPALRDKFDRLPAGTAPRKGDVAFWGNAPATPYTHVAIVIADQGGSLLCLTQNPGATHQASITKNGLLGATCDPRPARLPHHPTGSLARGASTCRRSTYAHSRAPAARSWPSIPQARPSTSMVGPREPTATTGAATSAHQAANTATSPWGRQAPPTT